MSSDQFGGTWHDELVKDAERCRALAREAIDAGSMVGAREWFEAAEAAMKAASACYPQPPPTIIQGGQVFPTPPTVSPAPGACRYCHLPFDMCRGHTICESAT